MLSIYKLKPKFQKLLKPILTTLHKAGISANAITTSSIVLSLLIGLAFWYGDKYPMLFLVVPIGLLLRMALNALDGMMARVYNQQSRKGEVLNEIGDIISDFFIFFPLIKYERDSIYLVVIFIGLSIINEYAGILGKAVGGDRRYEGPMGKSDRAFVLSIFGLLYYFYPRFSEYSDYIFIALIALLVISTLARLKKSIA